ncbi:MAG: NADPH:quinone reductase-like Zn-dependent oxidoreductase [Chlamydiales bacterium]|jgi:NADPH:quinone reductase-like Zn-dependent oxidoreductase
MNYLTIRKPGGYERLEIAEMEAPNPSPDEVLVEVKASGVNFADILIRLGVYPSAKTFVGWPITPGFEFSGVITETGSNVSKFKIGDPVFGVKRFGAHTGALCVPEKSVFLKPNRCSFAEAAGFPVVFITAYHALLQNVTLRPGMKILVHSAAGGVGQALVQLAKLNNCFVIAIVGSTHKVDKVKLLNPNHIIDKSTKDLWEIIHQLYPEGLDLIFDANGVDSYRKSFQHLRPTGKLIAYGAHSMIPKKGGRLNWPKLLWDYLRTPRFNPLDLITENKGVVGFNLSYLFDRDDLLNDAINALLLSLNAGEIQPLPVTTYPLADVAKAHRDMESGQTVGKLVLTHDTQIV